MNDVDALGVDCVFEYQHERKSLGTQGAIISAFFFFETM